MKKSKLAINILIVLIFIISLITFSLLMRFVSKSWDTYGELKAIVEYYEKLGSTVSGIDLNEYYNDAVFYTLIEVFTGLSSAIALSVLCIIDIPLIKNYASMTKEQRAQNKAAKEQQKAERAEAEKQKRIEQLQAELEELKKD